MMQIVCMNDDDLGMCLFLPAKKMPFNEDLSLEKIRKAIEDLRETGIFPPDYGFLEKVA